jgi:hypothetical protein
MTRIMRGIAGRGENAALSELTCQVSTLREIRAISARHKPAIRRLCHLRQLRASQFPVVGPCFKSVSLKMGLKPHRIQHLEDYRCQFPPKKGTLHGVVF